MEEPSAWGRRPPDEVPVDFTVTRSPVHAVQAPSVQARRLPRRAAEVQYCSRP